MFIKGMQPRQKSPDESLPLSQFPHGLNTVVPADRIAVSELSKCINWMLRKGGTLETRPVVLDHSTSAVTGNKTIKFSATANIGGTVYTLIVDSDYKVWYYDSALNPKILGILEGEATILSFNGVAMIFDGSYIKYLDSIVPTDNLTNGNVETWSGGPAVAPDGWGLFSSDASAVIGRESITKYQGSYSAKITRNSADADIFQQFDTAKGIAYWKGKTARFGAWVYATEANRARLQIWTDAGDAWTSYHTGDSTWQYLTVDYVIPAGATQAIVGCYVMGGAAVAYFDSITLYCAEETVKIAYDAGSGLTGYQLDNLALSNDTFLALGNGTNVRVGQKFTSQAWTAGYTIPITSASFYLSKVLTPTGDILVKLRDFATDAVMASKTLTTCAAVSGTASKFTAYFTASDITTQMSPSTAYYISLEYAGGDAANYIKVHTHTEASGGLAFHFVAAWAADATHNCLAFVGPGRPPKGKFATIWNKRPWVMGDPDKPGALWYGNLSHLDWSTTDGGGYLGIIDDDSNNFEVGAIASFYGNLYAFGTQNQPYLVKISGADPSGYAQETAFQKPWTTYKLLASAMNDLWFAGDEGVSPLSGVQEYGDLRSFFASDPVLDRITKYFNTSTAFASYFPQNGQYWLIMPLYHRVLVCHTKQAVQAPDGGTRYPWVEYEFYRDDFTNPDNYKWTANGNEYYLEAIGGGTPGLVAKPDFITLDGKAIIEGTAGALNDHEWDYALDPTLTYYTIYLRDASGDPDTSGVSVRSILLPTCLGQCDDKFLLGGSDGFSYKMDDVDYKDKSTVQIKPVMATAYMEVPFTHANFSQFQSLVSSKAGGQIRMKFFTDGAYLTPTHTKTIEIGLRDDLTVEDMTMDVEDAIFDAGVENIPMFEQVNFNGRMVMVEMDDVIISGYPIFNSGIILNHRRLRH